MKEKIHTATIDEITITNYPNKIDPGRTVTKYEKGCLTLVETAETYKTGRER